MSDVGVSLSFRGYSPWLVLKESRKETLRFVGPPTPPQEGKFGSSNFPSSEGLEKVAVCAEEGGGGVD